MALPYPLAGFLASLYFVFLPGTHGATHGDRRGEGEDELVQLHGGGGGAEFLHAGAGQAVAEGFQQHGGLLLSQGDEVAGQGIVIDGALQLLAHAVEGGSGGEAHVGHQALGLGALLLRHADAAVDFQSVDVDGICHRGGGGGCAAAFHKALQGAQVGHGEVRVGEGELGGVVVAGEHADADDAGTVGGAKVKLVIENIKKGAKEAKNHPYGKVQVSQEDLNQKFNEFLKVNNLDNKYKVVIEVNSTPSQVHK